LLLSFPRRSAGTLTKENIMPLTWSIENVEDCQVLIDDDTERAVTDALVWHLMNISMTKITASNWTEVYARIALAEKLDGASITSPAYRAVDPMSMAYEDSLAYDDYVRIDGELFYVTDCEIDDEGYTLTLARYIPPDNMFGRPKRGEEVVVRPEGLVDKHIGFEPRPIEPHDVKRRIGMHTNVSTESRAKWITRTMGRWLDERVKLAERKTE
jgi:hypothetical protein